MSWQRYTVESPHQHRHRASQVWLHTPLVQGKRENFAAAQTGFRDTAVPVETFTAALSKYKFKLRSVFFLLKSSLLSVL